MIQNRIPKIAAIVSLSLPVWASAGSTAPTTNSVIDLTSSKAATVTAADAVDTVREGTHIVGRTGRLVHTPDGQTAMLVFDNDGAGGPDSTMIVQPNLWLFLMEGVTTSKTEDFRVSGTVAEYKGHNYILLDNVETTLKQASTTPDAIPASPPTKHAIVPTKQPAAAPPQHVTVAAPGEPVVSKMDRLLSSAPNSGQELSTAGLDNRSTIDTATGKTAIAPDAPVLKVIRENTYLINRTGRLNHSSDGQRAIFTFEADGKTMADPPMIILPNLKLFSMEGQVLGRAGDLHFRVSGTITEYKGRNYILLDKAVAMADAETQF